MTGEMKVAKVDEGRGKCADVERVTECQRRLKKVG
jgi:hypothetical protein